MDRVGAQKGSKFSAASFFPEVEKAEGMSREMNPKPLRFI